MLKNIKKYIPTICFIFILMFLGIVGKIFPFGNNSILTLDLHHQYYSYLIELREKILSFDSLFFSATTPMGSNFWTEFAYYCSSPLNLLLILIPKHILPYFINIFIFLKLLLIPLSINYFLIKKEQEYKYNFSTIQSTSIVLAYSLSSFFLLNYWNIIWIETFALFPLIILALERGLNKNKWGIYSLLLFLSIWCNFYMSFISCIGITMYFFLKVKYDNTFIKNFINFALFSILGALLSSITLIPLIFELMGSESSIFPSFKIMTNFIDILSSHLIINNNEVVTTNLYNVKPYIGLLPLIIIPHFLINKNFSKKEKILYSSYIIFLILSFNTQPLNYIWHCLHNPKGITNRFVYIYIFILIDIFIKILSTNNKEKSYLKYLSIIILFTLTIYNFDKINSLTINLVFISIYLFFCIIYDLYKKQIIKNRKETKKLITNFLYITFITEIILNSIIAYIGFQKIPIEYLYNENLMSISEKYNSKDNFYRIDIEQDVKDNLKYKELQNMNLEKTHNMYSISGFSSIINKHFKNITENIGISDSSIKSKETGITALTSGLFSTKYFILKNTSKLPIKENRTLIENINEFDIYKNNYFLKPIIKINKDVEGKNKNPFINLNNIAKNYSGINNNIFKIIKPEYTTEQINTNTDDILNEHGQISAYKIRIKNIKENNLLITLPLLLNSQHQTIYKNNEIIFQEYTNNFEEIIDIGNVNENDIITIYYFLDNTKKVNLDNFNIFFASFNAQKYNEIFEKLKENNYDFNFKNNTISFNINNKEKSLYFISMAYHEGWKAYINNKETKIIPLMYDSMIGLELPAGENNVKLIFTPPGFYLGASLSIISLIILIIISSFKKKH